MSAAVRVALLLAGACALAVGLPPLLAALPVGFVAVQDVLLVPVGLALVVLGAWPARKRPGAGG